MRRSWWMGALTVGFVVAVGASARAQEGAFPVPKPTKEHEILKQDVGTWEASIKSWMDPKAEPMESKGTETNRALPGGLWYLSQFRGEFGGQTFHGRGQTGYDTVKKKYVGTWIDTMSTSIMPMEGTYDADTKTMTMFGEAPGPDGKLMKFKNVSTFKGTQRVFTMYMKPEGAPDWIRSMEITYKKVETPVPAKKTATKP